MRNVCGGDLSDVGGRTPRDGIQTAIDVQNSCPSYAPRETQRGSSDSCARAQMCFVGRGAEGKEVNRNWARRGEFDDEGGCALCTCGQILQRREATGGFLVGDKLSSPRARAGLGEE